MFLRYCRHAIFSSWMPVMDSVSFNMGYFRHAILSTTQWLLFHFNVTLNIAWKFVVLELLQISYCNNFDMQRFFWFSSTFPGSLKYSTIRFKQEFADTLFWKPGCNQKASTWRLTILGFTLLRTKPIYTITCSLS